MSKFFLYNGVKLPALPEWDKTVYPYAFIYIVTLDGTTGVYTLVVSSSSVMGYDGNGIICPSATVGQRYTVSEDRWAAAAASDDFYIKRDNLIYTVWANFDVLNSDGSVYVAASEPVPVADKFPLQGWLNWHVIGLCSRPLPLSKKNLVGHLYNGVALSVLPEYDKTAYPYAIIIKTTVSGLENPYALYICSTPFYIHPDGVVITLSSSANSVYVTIPYASLWVSGTSTFDPAYQYASVGNRADLLWSNDNIKSITDGSVLFETYEPDPIYG